MSIELNMFEASEKPQILVLRHPVSDEPIKDVELQVVGSDSPVFKEVDKIFASKRLNAFASKKKGEAVIGYDDIVDEKIEKCSACVVGWSGLTLDGKPFEYSKENSKMLMVRFSWICAQVEAFINDRSNFFKSA